MKCRIFADIYNADRTGAYALAAAADPLPLVPVRASLGRRGRCLWPRRGQHTIIRYRNDTMKAIMFSSVKANRMYFQAPRTSVQLRSLWTSEYNFINFEMYQYLTV